MISEDDFYNFYMVPLVSYLRIDGIKRSWLLKNYYNELKNIEPERIYEACEWVKNNFEYMGNPKFPVLKFFHRGLDATRKSPSTFAKDEPENSSNDRAEAEKRAHALAKKFKIYKPKKKNAIDDMKEKIKLKMLYSHKLGKWVHESLKGNVGGNFIYPAEFLKEKGILVSD